MQVPFTLENINKLFGEVKKSLQGDARNAAHYIGRLATNYARETKGYDDQTGNLTNSINYAVVADGQVENIVNAEQNGDHPVAREIRTSSRNHRIRTRENQASCLCRDGIRTLRRSQGI